MFSSGPNYTKLKTHLRLAINRLKLLEKKKNELAQKARKEIADYISAGKVERAKIRVEHIIREDYLVEAMEIVEMYCDLLLARFGLIQQMKVLDEGLAEAISSILWAAPRLQDVPELKVISELLTAKYGKEYNMACREGAIGTISEKLKHKLGVQALPKLLIEKYLIEIANNFHIEYTPDPMVMKDDEKTMGVDSLLVDLGNEKNNLGEPGFNPQPAGFIGFPQPPMLPQTQNNSPFNYPGLPNAPGANALPPPLPQAPTNVPFGAPFSYNIPPNDQFQDNTSKPLNVNLDKDSPPPPYSSFPPDLDNINQQDSKPKPMPRAKLSPGGGNFPDLPELPNVPSDTLQEGPSHPDPNDDIDFDDLARRFEDLKRKK